MLINSTGIFNILPSRDGMRVIEGVERIQRDYSDYLRDESNYTGTGVEAIFFPKSLENIVYALKLAAEKGKPITVSGGRTGICAGAVPHGGFLISLERMTRILGIEKRTDGYELKAQCGIRLNELSERLRAKNLGIHTDEGKEFEKAHVSYFYPPDPTETSATLGGTVATNASGARTFFYGPTRNYVVALEVVLPSGELLRVRRGDVREENGYFAVEREEGSPLVIPAPGYHMPVVKHAAGFYSSEFMDLIDLFIGSEGILGIIATVTIRLVEGPPPSFSAVTFFKDENDALEFVIHSRKVELKPLAIEYFDASSLSLLDETRRYQGPMSEIPEIPGAGGAVYFESAYSEGDGLRGRISFWSKVIKDHGSNPNEAWCALTKRDISRMKYFRHALPECINSIIARHKQADPGIYKVGTDMAVPDEHLKEMVGYYRSQLCRSKIHHVIFGHVGNNHLHLNMIPENYTELEEAKALYMMFARKAVSLGGTVSAEHGIGKIKKEYLQVLFPEQAIEDMMRIKRTLDPENILNPDTML